MAPTPGLLALGLALSPAGGMAELDLKEGGRGEKERRVGGVEKAVSDMQSKCERLRVCACVRLCLSACQIDSALCNNSCPADARNTLAEAYS